MTDTRAIVVGASIAGLLAARAASEHFDRVTLIERDALGDEPTSRKGTPQGNQIHVLLPIGLEMIEELFPGFATKLDEQGCSAYSQTASIPNFGQWGWNARVQSDVTRCLGFRRPVMEWLLRRELLAIANVEALQGAVTGLVMSPNGEETIGVRLKGSAEALAADLVVDASGRGSRAPKWLEEAGFAPPAETHVRPYMGYASQIVRVPDGLLPAGALGLTSLPFPGRYKGGVLLPADSGYHTLTAAGMLRHYPPSDPAGFLAFLDEAPSPLLGRFARRCEPAGTIHTYHMPGNQRRLWEELERQPERFVVVGDAVASFNPIYGQGMTMAAHAAVQLRAALRGRTGDLRGLAREFQESLGEKTDVAFAMAARADARYDGIEIIGRGLPSETEDDRLYGTRVAQLATEDPEVVMALARTGFYMKVDELDTPEIRSKVAEWAAAGGPLGDPDPTRIPDEVHELTAR